MKLINRYIKQELKGDSDLIDSVSLIDSSLTYEEQKGEIQPSINHLLTAEQKLNKITDTTKTAIKEDVSRWEKEGEKQIIKQIWKANRRRFKQLRKATTQLSNSA